MRFKFQKDRPGSTVWQSQPIELEQRKGIREPEQKLNQEIIKIAVGEVRKGWILRYNQ